MKKFLILFYCLLSFGSAFPQLTTTKITELPAASNADSGDVFPFVDISASKTKKITAYNLFYEIDSTIAALNDTVTSLRNANNALIDSIAVLRALLSDTTIINEVYETVYYFHQDSARNTPQHFNSLIDSLVAGDTVIVDGLTWTIEDSTDVLRIRDISGTNDLPIVFIGINGTKITTWVGLPSLTWTQYVDDLWFDYDRDDVEDGGESYHVADTVWVADFQFSGSYDANGRYIRVKADNGSGFNELEYGNTDGVTGEAGKLKRYDNYTLDEYNWFVNSQKRIGMWPEGNEIYLYCSPGTDPNNDNDAYDSLMFIGQVSQVNGVWDDSSRCVIHVVNANYITIAGFRIEGGIQHQILVENSKRLTLDGNELLWGGEYGISAGVNYARSFGAQNCDSVVIKNNVIDSYDRQYFAASTDAVRLNVNAIQFWAHTQDAGTLTRWWDIYNNTIRGFHCNILLGENENNLNTMYKSSSHKIRNNNISGFGTLYSKPMQINGSDSISFYNNKVDSCGAPIQLGCWSDGCVTENYSNEIYIFNNTFHYTPQDENVHDSGTDFINIFGCDSIWIFNNTCYDLYMGNILDNAWETNDYRHFWINNAFINVAQASHAGNYYPYHHGTSRSTYFTFASNVFATTTWDSTTTDLFYLSDATPSLYTLSEFESAHGSEPDSNYVKSNKAISDAYSTVINTSTLDVVSGSYLISNGDSIKVKPILLLHVDQYGDVKDRFNNFIIDGYQWYDGLKPNIGGSNFKLSE